MVTLKEQQRKMKRIEPKAGQESVWDYPRPPKLELTNKHLKIIFNGEIIAETNRAFRVLETSHPPVYYFPPEDVRMEFLTKASGSSFCEWKGSAGYYDLQVGEKSVIRIRQKVFLKSKITSRFIRQKWMFVMSMTNWSGRRKAIFTAAG